MKARIEELKKMKKGELILSACNIAPQEFSCFHADLRMPCIEVVSARMWEKAAKECYEYLRHAMGSFVMNRPGDARNYFLFDATPAEKLICAIVALEEKESKSNE